jgi:hypothetical protein
MLPKKTPKHLTFTTILLSSLYITACGGGGSSNSLANNSEQNGNDQGNNPNNGNAVGARGFDKEGNLLHSHIPAVQGLTSNEVYQGPLFYTVENPNHSGPDKYVLKSVNPSLTPVAPVTVTSNIQKMDGNSFDTVYSFPKASVNNGGISDYQIDRIFLLEKTGNASFQTKVVQVNAVGVPIAEPLSLSVSMPGMAINYAFQHHLTDPKEATFSYMAYGSNLPWYMTTLEPGKNRDVHFDDELRPLVSLVSADTHAPNGWIMGDWSSNSSKLYEYDADGSLRGELKANGNTIPNVITGDKTKALPGTVFDDGSQLLVIHQIDQTITPIKSTETVYRYTPGSNGNAGDLQPLKNSANENLELRQNVSAKRGNIAVFDNATYLFDGDGQNYELYRLEKDTWEEVPNMPKIYTDLTALKAGKFMVWHGSNTTSSDAALFSLNSETNTIVELDHTIDNVQNPLETLKTERLSDPFFGNHDDMVYYNRVQSVEIKTEITIGETTFPINESREWVEAVARKADGTGEPQVILHAFWKAASSNGKGDLRGHMSLFDVGSRARGITNSMQISEMFLVTKHYIDETEDNSGNRLYASENNLVSVNAANPKAGKVVLGQLPDDFKFSYGSYLWTSEISANLGELGSGSHRLISFKREYSGDSDCALVFVNTQQENSLIDLEPSNSGNIGKCQAVRGF